MGFKLIITERTEEQIDHCLDYIVRALKNPAAAASVIEDIQTVYQMLEQNPEIYGLCEDEFLRARGYHKVSLPKHRYLFLYRIQDHAVLLSGFFHGLENYPDKI